MCFSKKKAEGVEWASSGFNRVPDYAGPIWAGNNTFLVNAFNLNAFGRGLMLSHGLQEPVSPGLDLPHAPGWRIDSHQLNSTHEATNTALPPETGAQATELFLFMPYFIHHQSYFHCIRTVISNSKNSAKNQTGSHLTLWQECLLFLSLSTVLRSWILKMYFY